MQEIITIIIIAAAIGFALWRGYQLLTSKGSTCDCCRHGKGKYSHKCEGTKNNQ